MVRSCSRYMLFAMLCAAALLGETRAAASPIKPGVWRSGVEWLQPAGFDPATLDGRVVVVEFWTFGCINCRRTTPAMRELRSRLPADVAVVGIHTPELDHERDSGNVRRAIARERITFPVAQDNAYTAWRAFDNHYWPALYVLDRAGRIRHTHVGELHVGTPRWDRLRKVIEELRAESPKQR